MTPALDFSILLRDDYPQWILQGLVRMLELTALAWILSMLLGMVLAIARMSRPWALRAAVAAYVEYHQNVPMVVQIFIWYFGIPALLPLGMQQWFNARNGEFIFVLVALSLCMGAYISEALRGGIRSIPVSQVEAARALGLNFLQASRLVVLPQAFRIALPTLVNLTVLLFKNTSLAMIVGVAELTYVTREIESLTFRTIEVYLFTTVVYLGISLAITGLGGMLEKRYRLAGR